MLNDLLTRLARRKYSLLMFLVLSLVSGGTAIHTWFRGKQTLDWTPVQGQVVSRENARERDGSIEIHIEYVVNGVTHHVVVNQLVIEDLVTIYVDPRQPGMAVLTPGVDGLRLAMFCLLSCVGVIGVLANGALALWPQLMSEEAVHEGDSLHW